MKRSIAISDIHGCAKTFDRLLWDKVNLTKQDHLFLLGDYVNRGPDSKGVLDRIFYLRKKNYNLTLLRGNHDEILVRSLKSKNFQNALMRSGGKMTLASFNVKKTEDIPAKYLKLLNSMDYFFKGEKYLLVHAGFNFANKNIFKDKDAMLWARRMAIRKEKLKGRFIVHGHTPQPKIQIKQQFNSKKWPNSINIDGGCVNHPKLGSRLIAMNLETGKLYFSKNVES